MAKRTRLNAKTQQVRVNIDETEDAVFNAADDGECSIVNFRRPATREECACVPRPCPFVGCRYNLYLDVTEAGNVYVNFPDVPVLEMEHSCVLDLAEKGPWSLRETSQILGLTPERIRQIEIGVIEKLRYSDLSKHQQEGKGPLRQYTMTGLLLNPKCKTLILRSLQGKLDVERLHQLLLSQIQGSISLIKLRAFITSKVKKNE